MSSSNSSPAPTYGPGIDPSLKGTMTTEQWEAYKNSHSSPAAVAAAQAEQAEQARIALYNKTRAADLIDAQTSQGRQATILTGGGFQKTPGFNPGSIL